MVALSVWPSAAVPVIDGSAVFTGAIGRTAAVAGELTSLVSERRQLENAANATGSDDAARLALPLAEIADRSRRVAEEIAAVKQAPSAKQTLRYRTTIVNDDLTSTEPHKPLLEPKQRTGGRRNSGDITSWHRGGGHKRMLREVDFKRDKLGIPAKVAGIEYDPGRSARIALLHYKDGEKRYIIAPLGLKPGDMVMSGPQADILPGNALPIRNIPLGTLVHNVELQPGKGGQLCRSAGTLAQLLAKEGDHANLKLPSGEVRQVKLECMATVGQVGNLDHENISVGKAGRVRWRGFRPTVRGTVMNPVDHPMGGGEGKGKGNHPMTPWGKPTKGYKTRRGARPSDRYIVTRRTK